MLGIRFRSFERLVNLVCESDTYRAYDEMRFSQNVNYKRSLVGLLGSEL